MKKKQSISSRAAAKEPKVRVDRRDPVRTWRPAPELIEAVDRWAVENHTSRSDAMRQLIELGLKATARGKAKGAP